MEQALDGGRVARRLCERAPQEILVELRLSDVTVEIDRGGKIVAYFRADRGRSLTFTGQVMGSEGPGRIKADVASEDRRLRGPMYLSVDDRRQVNSITLEATDGRDRMRLSWDRR